MIISLQNLQDGIVWWKEVKPKWGSDMGNTAYDSIYSERTAGLTEEWWTATVDLLSTWRAIRGPNGINSKSKVKEAGLTVLHKMAEQYSRIRSLSTHEPTIEDVRWEDLVSLFEIAFWIKWPERRIASPVFASKLCHFIFPNVFPVVDNEATGYFDYEFLWRGMKDEWLRFPNRDEAKAVLLGAMENTSKHELYPIETRIIELCHIGYANARGTSLREALPAPPA